MCVCACVRACVTIIWQVHQVNNYRPLEKGISLATSLGLSTREIDSISIVHWRWPMVVPAVVVGDQSTIYTWIQNIYQV